MGEGSAFAIFYGAMLSLALVIGVAGLALGIIRKKKSTTIIGGFFLAIPAVFAVVVLLASVTSERSPTTTARAPAPSASQPTPGDSSLAGKSVGERLQVLQALSRTSKATIYYPGDPYAGMSMVFIGSDLLAGEGPVAMSIHYAAEASDRSMTVDIYTPRAVRAVSGRARACGACDGRRPLGFFGHDLQTQRRPSTYRACGETTRCGHRSSRRLRDDRE